jgi:hypothetical protein
MTKKWDFRAGSKKALRGQTGDKAGKIRPAARPESLILG